MGSRLQRRKKALSRLMFQDYVEYQPKESFIGFYLRLLLVHGLLTSVSYFTPGLSVISAVLCADLLTNQDHPFHKSRVLLREATEISLISEHAVGTLDPTPIKTGVTVVDCLQRRI